MGFLSSPLELPPFPACGILRALNQPCRISYPALPGSGAEGFGYLSPRRLAWQSLPEDWPYADIPPRDFVFHGALPVGCVTLLMAPGGAGKSMLCLSLALSVAAGRALAGFEPTRAGRVALVNLEDDRREIEARLQRIAHKHGFSPQENLAVRNNLRFLPVPTFEAVKAGANGGLEPGGDLESLRRLLADLRPRLVVLDPLAALLGGTIEENSNEAAQAVVGLLRDAMPPDAGVLIATHVSKAERGQSYSARGASAWMDASRMALALRPLNSKEQASVPAGEEKHRYLALEVRKSNYGPLQAPVYFRRDAEPETAGTLSVVDFDAMRSDADKAIFAAIHEALRSMPEGITRKEAKAGGETPEAIERGQSFRDAVSKAFGTKVSCQRIDAAIGTMKASGAILQKRAGRRQILVSAEEGI